MKTKLEEQLDAQYQEFVENSGIRVTKGYSEAAAVYTGYHAFNKSTHEKYFSGLRVQGTAFHKLGSSLGLCKGTCKGFAMLNGVEHLIVQWDNPDAEISMILQISGRIDIISQLPINKIVGN